MPDAEIIRIGKRGTVVIPAALRRAYNLKEGTILSAEMKEEGILLRSVLVLPVEKYSDLRKAEFLPNNAVTPKDYDWAVKEAQEMGLVTEKQKPIRNAWEEAFGIWKDMPESGEEFVRSLRESDRGRMEDLNLV